MIEVFPSGTRSQIGPSGIHRSGMRLSSSGSSAGFAAAVLADSPISYWRLGESSGTNAVDQRGANAGTYTGGFTLSQAGATTDGNTSVALNGTTGYVPVTAALSLRPSAQVTVEAWINPTAIGANGTAICSNSFTTKVGYELGFGIDGVGTALKFGSFDGASWHVTADPGSAPPTGSFTHVAGVYDGVNLILYKNGVAVGTPTAWAGPLGYDATEFRIGRHHSGTFWGGALDEVAVYSTGLSAARILAHFNAR